MTLSAGRKFAHFEIIKKLGEGGMGEVFLAEDLKLNRKVALKVLHPEFFDNLDRLERFKREARTAAQISNPNVMAIHDIDKAIDEDSQKEINYIVMEYIEGDSLAGYLAAGQRTISDLLKIAQKTASGLAEAHKLNIVHRDIKAENIIIEESGEPKILDFGLAKPTAGLITSTGDQNTQTISQELTQEGRILGTVSYMSPEQARGEKVDARSDIFSFGILLYKMFTGKFPFDGSDNVSTIAKILESRQAPIRQIEASLPPELERIIDKCLQKDPNDRYQDTRDLVVDLRTLRRQFDSGISSTDSLIIEKPKIRKTFRLNLSSRLKAFLIILFAIMIFVIVLDNFTSHDDEIGGGFTKVAHAGNNVLAILDFENQTGDKDLDWLQAGLPEILLTDLAEFASGNLIGRNRIMSRLEHKNKKEDEPVDHQELVKAAQSLGAETALSGSYYKMGDRIRIDARVEDLTSGQIILGEKVIGDDPFVLVDSLTDKIAKSLNLQEKAQSGIAVSSVTSSSPEAYKQYILGLEKFNLSLNEEAIDYFKKAIEIDSTFALPYMRIGMIYAFQNRQKDAGEYLAQAKQYENKLPIKERSLLNVYTSVWLEAKYDEAFTKLKSYVENYPDDWEGRFFYAVFLSQLGNDKEGALGQLDTLIMMDPTDRWALELGAEIYSSMDDYDRAIEFAKKSKAYYPESPTSYGLLAVFYRIQGKFDKAIEEEKALLDLNPANPNALEQLTSLYILVRDFDKAAETAKKFTEYYPDDPYRMYDYYSIMTNLSSWEGKFSAAMGYRKRGLEQRKLTGDSSLISSGYFGIANVYLENNQRDSALTYTREGAKWANLFDKFNLAMNLIRIDLKYKDEALDIFEWTANEFRSRLPEQMWPVTDKLRIVFDGWYEADTAKVLEGYDSLLALPAQQVRGNYLSGGQYAVLTGQYEKGIEYLANIISGDIQTTSATSYQSAVYYTALAYYKLGQTDKAKDYVSRYLETWKNPDIKTDEYMKARELMDKLRS